MVYAILLARVPVSDAEDLVQEVFISALRKLQLLRTPAAFPGWLRGILAPLVLVAQMAEIACWWLARLDGPTGAVRYWGLTQQEYYDRADVWPLSPKGEIFVILMMEDTRGIEALSDILTKVPGIGAILIGEGDLSQELGYPRQYEHPVVLEWMARVVKTCKQHNVVVGHPHVDSNNVERILGEGYRFLMAAPVRSYAALDKGLKLAGRA